MNKANIDIDTTFKYYYRPLCLYAIHYVRNMELAEDIVQDSFSALWEKLNEQEHPIENLKAYLYTMVRNRSLDYLKKEQLFDMSLSPADLEETLTDEEAENRSLMEARMWTAIDALPERCREVFLLNKRDGMKYIIRKTKCFDFWERNVLFPKTKRSFFRTPTLPFSA